MKKCIIAPSLLSANFNNLNNEFDKLTKSNINWVHYDVMDGHFVPNISFGYGILNDVTNEHKQFFYDVHLMIDDTSKFYKSFINSGASLITFHYESLPTDEKVAELIKEIKSNGVKVGLSIKPATDYNKIIKFLPILDLVLVMSVEPGFGGQSFMESSLAKISGLKKNIVKNNLNVLVEVDGGINDKTGKLVLEAGADVLVAGSYLFKGDFKENVKKLLGE